MTESVVVHYRDGQLLKGQTTGFSGENLRFEVQQLHGGPQPISVELANLKAVFFVKDFVGNSAYDEIKAFRGDAHAPAPGWKSASSTGRRSSAPSRAIAPTAWAFSSCPPTRIRTTSGVSSFRRL